MPRSGHTVQILLKTNLRRSIGRLSFLVRVTIPCPYPSECVGSRGESSQYIEEEERVKWLSDKRAQETSGKVTKPHKSRSQCSISRVNHTISNLGKSDIGGRSNRNDLTKFLSLYYQCSNENMFIKTMLLVNIIVRNLCIPLLKCFLADFLCCFLNQERSTLKILVSFIIHLDHQKKKL